MRGIRIIRQSLSYGYPCTPRMGIDGNGDKASFVDTLVFFGYTTSTVLGGDYVADLTEGRTGPIIAKLEAAD